MRGARKGARGASQRNARQADAGYDQGSKRTRLGGGIKPLSGGGGIFKSAAVAVLKIERKLMTTGEITKVALERGLIKCQGKTPEATMASALYTDVKRKHDKSVFTRPQEGLFGLREWISEGFFPEGWVGPIDGLGVAPFKKRNSMQVKQPTRSSTTRSSKARSTQSWKEASSDFEEDPGEFDTMDEEDAADDEETEDLVEEEEPEEESPKPRSGTRGRTRGARDVSSGGGAGGGGGGGSRTTTTRSHEVPSGNGNAGGGGGGGGGVSATTKDQEEGPEALESPLHMLGEAAEMSKEPELSGGASRAAAEAGMGGKRKRRPSSIQVPEGALGNASGEEVLMPKSPFDDSLAALHEIATSPSTYAPSAMGGDGGGSKRRPRASMGLGDLGAALHGGGMGMGRQGSMSSPASLFHGLDSSSLAMLGDHGSLLSGPDTCKVPLISLNISSLASPRLLDGSGLMPLQLPDSLPATPDMLALAMNSAGLGSLISPQALGMGWSSRGLEQARYMSRRDSEGALGLLQMSSGGMPHTSSTRQPMHTMPVSAFSAGPGPSSAPQQQQPVRSRQYGGLTAQQVQEELGEIGRMRVVVERLEARMGRSNPQVGKAWLSLARMYQHVAGSGPEGRPQAAEALARARAVCGQFCAEHGLVMSRACEESFGYLASQVQGGGGADDGAPRPAGEQVGAHEQQLPNGTGGAHQAEGGQEPQQQQPPLLQPEATLAMDLRGSGTFTLDLKAGPGGAVAGDAAPAALQT